MDTILLFVKLILTRFIIKHPEVYENPKLLVQSMHSSLNSPLWVDWRFSWEGRALVEWVSVIIQTHSRSLPCTHVCVGLQSCKQVLQFECTFWWQVLACVYVRAFLHILINPNCTYLTDFVRSQVRTFIVYSFEFTSHSMTNVTKLFRGTFYLRFSYVSASIGYFLFFWKGCHSVGDCTHTQLGLTLVSSTRIQTHILLKCKQRKLRDFASDFSILRHCFFIREPTI